MKSWPIQRQWEPWKVSETMKCKECCYESFAKGNGNPNRYYCVHPAIMAGIGARMISRTERHSEERKHKTAPRWCPLSQK